MISGEVVLILNKEREAPPLALDQPLLFEAAATEAVAEDPPLPFDEALPPPPRLFSAAQRGSSPQCMIGMALRGGSSRSPQSLGDAPPQLLATALSGGTVEDQPTADQHHCIIPIPDEIVEENATTTGVGVPVNGGCSTDNQGGTETEAGGGQQVPMCHEVMKYIIPNLVAFSILMYQGNPGALFSENPVEAWCFLIFTCVYWLITREMKEMPHRSSGTKFFRILNHTAFVCALISVGSLLFIVLINDHKRSLLHRLFWVLLAAGLAWLLLFTSYIHFPLTWRITPREDRPPNP